MSATRDADDVETTAADSEKPARPAPPPPPSAGRPFGRYALQKELGHGGMGVVWKAWDTQLRRHVALKQIRTKGHLQTKALERFLREARLAARLQHPGIVRLLDAGRINGQSYLTTELVEGALVEDRLEHLIPIETAVRWIKTVAEALDYAHQNGVIHRDVKPGNILLDADGNPRVFDFGLAREFAEARDYEDPHPVTSSTGAILGTPDYMSPEQALGPADELTPATDQFSLGVVLYRLIAGRLPFVKTNLRQLLLAIAEEEPVPPGKLNPRVSRDLETICLKALEKDPARRYANMREMAADLGRYLEREPIHARPIDGLTRLVRKAVKHRSVLLPSAVAVALGIGFATYAWIHHAHVQRDVAAALDLGRRQRALNLPAEAHDAFARVLVLDAGNDEARAGDAWAKAQLAALSDQSAEAQQNARAQTASAVKSTQSAQAAQEAAAAAERDARAREAEARAAEARARERTEAARAAAEQANLDQAHALELARKPGLVTDTLTRWLDIAPALLEIEKVATNSRMAPESRAPRIADAWRSVQKFIDQTPSDPSSQATMKALAGWARRLAGHPDEGLEWIREARELDREGPYGPALEALAALSDAVAQYPMPPTWLGPSGLELGSAPAPSKETLRLLDEADGALDRVARAAVWGDALAAPCRKALAGARDLFAARHEAAEQGLSALIGELDFKVSASEIRCARAKARHRLRHFAAAAEDFEEISRLRPDHAETLFCLAEARLGAAADRTGSSRERVDAFQKAVAGYDAVIALLPTYAPAYAQRGLALWGLAGARADAGEDPEATLTQALASLDESVRRAPDNFWAYSHRGLVRSTLADLARIRGRPLANGYETAIADFDTAIARLPGFAQAYLGRGWCRVRLGDHEAASGGDARGEFLKAVHDFEETQHRNPDLLSAALGLAWAHDGLGRVLEALGEDPQPTYQRAIAQCDEAVKRGFSPAASYDARGWAQAHLAHALLGAKRNPAEYCERAIADFGEALKAEPARASARHGRGLALLVQDLCAAKLDTLSEALADLTEAARLDPLEPDVHLHLGMAHAHAFEWRGMGGEAKQKAFEQYAGALTSPSCRWRVLLHRAILYNLTGEFLKAAKDDDDAAKLVGENYRGASALAAAARARDQAQQRGVKTDRLVAMVLATHAMQRDDYEMAWKQYDKAGLTHKGGDLESVAALVPAVADAYMNIARIYATSNRANFVEVVVTSLPCRTRHSAVGDFPYLKDDPDGRQRLHEEEWRFLRKAMKLGFADRAYLNRESDFTAMRAEPAWKSTVEGK